RLLPDPVQRHRHLEPQLLHVSVAGRRRGAQRRHVGCGLQQPEGLEALEFIKEMVDNGWVPTEPISVDQPFEQTALAQGEAAYSLGTNLNTVRDVLDDEITVIPPMAHKEQVGLGSVGALSIFNTTDSPGAEAAWVLHLPVRDLIADVCSP